MPRHASKLILGSRSPRRLELLAQLVPHARIEVLPPRSSDEAGFDDLIERATIEARLREIARAKCDDVLAQVQGRADVAAIITADTTIIAADADGRSIVLGQPPEEDRQSTVRRWFIEYYEGRTHAAATAVCVKIPGGTRAERVVESEVTFHADVEPRLDWYLSTGESRGKAGGYAIQGAGSLFVSRIEGSLSNVIGLPLEALFEVFEELGIDVG